MVPGYSLIGGKRGQESVLDAVSVTAGRHRVDGPGGCGCGEGGVGISVVVELSKEGGKSARRQVLLGMKGWKREGPQGKRWEEGRPWRSVLVTQHQSLSHN